MDQITGRTLIAWGHEPAGWFGAAIAAAEALRCEGTPEAEIRAAVAAMAPPPPMPLRADPAPVHECIAAEDDAEAANLEAVRHSMRLLARTPVVEAAAIMPDACPAGPAGTVTVGGIAATKGTIHPGMHSADICCSVAITVVGHADPARLLDAASRVTHFGGGGRTQPIEPPAAIMARFEGNAFLSGVLEPARQHFATQGDGNHFLFVGRLASTGETVIVTHHGSRKPGAMLYKQGMKLAEAHTAKVAPEVMRQNAWIDADSQDGATYWDALQILRAWTKASHEAIHDMALEAARMPRVHRFWNEHNFVFQRGDVFYHGKGATPAWRDYAADASGQVLIPLNMGAPVLIAEGADNPRALGFCPHGAGRNRSRTAHMKRLHGLRPEDVLARETKGLDIRFHCGRPDLSELPSAYKDADSIVRQVEAFGLAKIVDRVEPYGSIMAGDWQQPFRDRKRAKRGHRPD